MRAQAIILTIVVAGFATLSDLCAQGQGGPCPEIYAAPNVGEYADLSFGDVGKGAMVIRFAVVGDEVVDNVRHYWVEIVSVPPEVGDTVIVQMLIPYYPFDNSDIKGYVVKMPGQPALKLTHELIAQLGEATPGTGWKEKCETAVELDPVQVTVPAGSFDSRHFRSSDQDGSEVWLANVPFGIVKWVQGTAEMELVAFGSNARSLLTVEPVEYVPPPDGR
jgi:hypothetical protein